MFLDEILNPNPADDVLRWLAEPEALRSDKGETWPSFAASTQQRYGLNLAKGPLDAAAVVLAADGWAVDGAVLTALAIAQSADCVGDVAPALAAVYRPWLPHAAESFQQRVAAEGYPTKAIDAVPEGTVVVFVDGLRFDPARQLEATLATSGLSVNLQHRFTSVPSVTSSGKVWCSPGYASAQTSATARI